MTNTLKLCRFCLKTEEEHDHNFEPLIVTKPDGCVCEALTWCDSDSDEIIIPAICEKYNGNGTSYCIECEHNKECHKQ